MGRTFVNDIGTVILLDTGTALAGASAVAIAYKKPSGKTGTWTGSVSATTKISYTTVSGDLDEAGIWLLQERRIPGLARAGGSPPLRALAGSGRNVEQVVDLVCQLRRCRRHFVPPGVPFLLFALGGLRALGRRLRHGA